MAHPQLDKLVRIGQLKPQGRTLAASDGGNRTDEYRHPKISFLADRNILVDDPMAKMFTPFGDTHHKITGGAVSLSRDIYFGIYQALSTANEEVFRQYRPDFFDLIIIDECHHGSSRDDSNWRAVLDYKDGVAVIPAALLGP